MNKRSEKRSILLVDDEYDNNSIFTISLQDAGFEVDAYNDPKLALSAFRPDYLIVRLILILLAREF